MSGRRAALGVAFKNARRNKKRTFYLVALIAIPVMVAVMTSAFVRLSYISPEERATSDYGQTNVLMERYSTDPEVEAWVDSTIDELAPGAERLTFRNHYVSFAPRVFGRILDVGLNDPLTEGILNLVDGRVPVTADGVVLTEHLASELEIGIGDTVELGDGEEKSFEVVGIASHPILWDVNDAVVAPEGMDRFDVRVDLATQIMLSVEDDVTFAQTFAQAWEQARYEFYPGDREWPIPEQYWFLWEELYAQMTDDQFAEMERIYAEDGEEAAMAYTERLAPNGVTSELPWVQAQSRTEQLTWNTTNIVETGPVIGTGVAALILAEVAFIAGAAFATGTRRRLREIGLMGANGASTKQVRSSVVGEGLVVGLVGGLSGAFLAFLLIVLGRPTIQEFVSRRIDGFPFSPLDVIGPIAVALVACVFAAWVPARTASGVPTLTALQGRMPVGAPKRWIIPVGLSLTALGVLLLAVGLAGQSGSAAAVGVIGAILMIGGTALLAGPLVAWISKHAERFPITPRIVLRDSGRQRGRAAAAVAATMVILMAPVAAMASIEQNEASQAINGLPMDRPQIYISGLHDGETGETMPLGDEELGRIESLVPGSSVASFDVIDVPVMYPTEFEALEDTAAGFGGDQTFDADLGQYYLSPWRMSVADPEILGFLDDDRLSRALEEDGIALIGVEERINTIEIDGDVMEVAEVPIAVQQRSFPRLMVTEETTSNYEAFDRRTSAVVEISETWLQSLNPFHEPARPLWEANWGESVFLDMSGGGGADLSSGVILALITLATMLVVLIVVATITALSAAEADSDLRTVVAVGATNSIRRKYLGLQSGIHTLLGCLLAVPLTLLLMRTVYSSVLGGYRQIGAFGVFDSSQLFIPWTGLALLVLGVPLAIGLITAASVRSAPTTPPRRAT